MILYDIILYYIILYHIVLHHVAFSVVTDYTANQILSYAKYDDRMVPHLWSPCPCSTQPPEPLSATIRPRGHRDLARRNGIIVTGFGCGPTSCMMNPDP